jgi:hypothetical protein
MENIGERPVLPLSSAEGVLNFVNFWIKTYEEAARSSDLGIP